MVMKRYIYIIGLALMATLAACEQKSPAPEPKPEPYTYKFYFDVVDIETTYSTALITTERPYVEINDVRHDGEVIFEWGELPEDYNSENGVSLKEIFDSLATTVVEPNEEEGKMAYLIEGLEPSHTYIARISLNVTEKNVSDRLVFTFKTKELPKHEFNFKTNVEAHGLYADIEMTDIVYTIDGIEQEIMQLEIEYHPQSAVASQKEYISGEQIVDNALTIILPESLDSRLMENTHYTYTVTAEIEGGHRLTSEEYGFTTTDARLGYEISTPILTLTDTELEITVERFYAIWDNRYTEELLAPALQYRATGGSWTNIESEKYAEAGLSATLDLATLAPDTTYEVRGSITIYDKDYYSDVATITTPKNETPIPDNGDTTDIAGTWNLVEWCGTTPSFKVIMVINTTGGVTLYQKMENREWECFESKAYIANGIIKGVYTDGKAWGADYTYSISGERMTWVDTLDSGDISVYERYDGELPAVNTTRANASDTIRYL